VIQARVLAASMAIKEPGGDCWRSPPGDPDSRGATFLSREEWRCTAPTGEESCDDAVAPKRSRRRRPSGRSAHHQRPFGRGLGQTGRGDQGDAEGPSGETGLA